MDEEADQFLLPALPRDESRELDALRYMQKAEQEALQQLLALLDSDLAGSSALTVLRLVMQVEGAPLLTKRVKDALGRWAVHENVPDVSEYFSELFEPDVMLAAAERALSSTDVAAERAAKVATFVAKAGGLSETEVKEAAAQAAAAVRRPAPRLLTDVVYEMYLESIIAHVDHVKRMYREEQDARRLLLVNAHILTEKEGRKVNNQKTAFLSKQMHLRTIAALYRLNRFLVTKSYSCTADNVPIGWSPIGWNGN